METIVDKKTKIVFAPRILQKFQSEKEYSIINYLARLLKQIIDRQNYKHILSCLFDKFQKQGNLVALETLLEIEEEFIDQISEDESTLLTQEQLNKQQLQIHQEFQKYFILYVMIPLLDYYSQTAVGQGSQAPTSTPGDKSDFQNKMTHRLMVKLLQISQQRDQVPVQTSEQNAAVQSQGDPCALIVIDWAIKSLNFQLDEKAAEGGQPDATEAKKSTKNALIYSSYINVVLANFDILHSPWHTINITPKLTSLLQTSPSLGMPALVNLLGRLCLSILQEIARHKQPAGTSDSKAANSSSAAEEAAAGEDKDGAKIQSLMEKMAGCKEMLGEIEESAAGKASEVGGAEGGQGGAWSELQI